MCQLIVDISNLLTFIRKSCVRLCFVWLNKNWIRNETNTHALTAIHTYLISQPLGCFLLLLFRFFCCWLNEQDASLKVYNAVYTWPCVYVFCFTSSSTGFLSCLYHCLAVLYRLHDSDYFIKGFFHQCLVVCLTACLFLRSMNETEKKRQEEKYETYHLAILSKASFSTRKFIHSSFSISFSFNDDSFIQLVLVFCFFLWANEINEFYLNFDYFSSWTVWLSSRTSRLIIINWRNENASPYGQKHCDNFKR